MAATTAYPPRTALSTSVATVAWAEDKDLIVFDWSGYEAPEFHPAYTEKHGDEPTFTFFGDEEEAFQKIRSGFKTDLAHPCSQSVVKWREAGLLQPLEFGKAAQRLHQRDQRPRSAERAMVSDRPSRATVAPKLLSRPWI